MSSIELFIPSHSRDAGCLQWRVKPTLLITAHKVLYNQDRCPPLPTSIRLTSRHSGQSAISLPLHTLLFFLWHRKKSRMLIFYIPYDFFTSYCIKINYKFICYHVFHILSVMLGGATRSQVFDLLIFVSLSPSTMTSIECLLYNCVIKYSVGVASVERWTHSLAWEVNFVVQNTVCYIIM